MSVVSVKARSFILALFIRDDGERFLLGDNGYDFKEKQLHFAGNNIENDEVAIQGADGVLLAGQVRRASVQSFDGYVGDGSVSKERIEQMRRDFIGFFAKGHHFRVIYIDCARNAWQRKGGYLVDAPEVKELWQIHPEYHVGLNFEDVNYYEYDEDAEGEEILSNLFNLPISSAVEGGLVWDEDGAVSEDAETDEVRGEVQSASGSFIELDLSSRYGRLDSATIKGNTSQSGTPTPDAPVAVQTVTGENVVKICGKNLYNETATPWVATTHYNTTTGAIESWANYYGIRGYQPVSASTQYIVSSAVSGNLQVVFYDGSKTFLSATSGSASFTTPANCQYVRWSRYTETAPTNTQLELGSTATTYEPYQGQSYEVNLGKNLFDKDNANILSAYIDSGQKTITANNNNRIIWIKCEPSTTYTITKTPANYQRGIAYTKELPTSGVQTYGYSSGQNNWGNLSFTTGADAEYLVIRIWVVGQDSASLDDMLASVQIEKGSTATSYAAYFTPIELCKIGDYQDYIYKSGDKWYVHKEVEHRSITASSRSSIDVGQTNTARVNYGAILSSKKPTSAVAGYMNYAVAASTSNWSADNAGFYWDGGNGGFWVRFLKSAVGSTTTDVDSFLSGKTFELYYPLATTPADTEITNEALITQLEALRTASLVSGENNIGFGVVAPNIAGELEINYYGYEIIVVSGGYIWEAGGSGGPTILINDSISNVMPIWTVFGPALNPQLENITTGSVIQYVGSVAEGQTLVVDMGEQTANLSGLNVISDMVGDWIDLAPGSNRMIYSADADNTPDSEIGWSDIVG